ncbi:recombinase family protein [uncultured Roseobacter sp.]|uniref:recombinase family protein n=1 Tax=uncultured Roseobacter sp. TaxID=114847 RepID=UPI002624B64B|nr:recombinase family protein [uncultured Roseobacter sp.]
MKKLGYLRVSTHEQRPDRQIDGMRGLCDELFIEHASGATMKRPVFDQVLNELQNGDTLFVWDLDRAFRSTLDAIQTADALQQRSVALNIVNLQLDTRTPAGRLVYTVLSACAEFERRLISQRTKEGLAAARRRGKKLGRPPILHHSKLETAKQQIDDGTCPRELASELGVHPYSLMRAIRRDLGGLKLTTSRHTNQST